LWLQLEQGLNQTIWLAVNLPLRERPQLNGLHSTGQRIGQTAQTQYSGGTCQQEPAWGWFGVHQLLHGQEQFRRPLHLINHHAGCLPDKAGWVLPGRLKGGSPVQTEPLSLGLAGQPCHQSAFAALPGPVYQHHPGVRQRH